MKLTTLSHLSTQALQAEIWRRSRAGLAAQPLLRAYSNDALAQELAQRGLAVEPAAWFGPRDDRRDPLLAQNLPAPLRAHARRSCYLIGAQAIGTQRRGRVSLHHVHYGEANSLCRSEPFWCQPSVVERLGESYGAYGYSGYLLGKRFVLTAWHGWEYFAREPQVAIFDYRAHSACDQPVYVSAELVVKVREYPRAQPQRDGGARDCPGDWVILELERDVEHLPPAPPLTLGAPLLGSAVYTLGYPCGLPLKIADGAQVLHLDAEGFRADLDTFTGNSGSPVFDAEQHALLGIVIEGQKGAGDFEPSPALRCYVSNRIDSRIGGQLSLPTQCFAAALAQLPGLTLTPTV